MSSIPSRWSRTTINRLWRDRTLRILVEPSPMTFAERRSVLQVLKAKGPIEVFRRVPNYPSQFIAVTKTEQTADALRSARNLGYNIDIPNKRPDINFVDLTKPEVIDGTKAIVETKETSTDDDKSKKDLRSFRLRIVGVSDYDHAGTMKTSPLHTSWPESFSDKETFMSATLKQSLPQNMSAPGLARWDYDLETGQQLSHAMMKEDLKKFWSWVPKHSQKQSRDKEPK